MAAIWTVCRVALVGDPILDGDVLSDRLAAIQRERRDIVGTRYPWPGSIELAS
jgi:hypothetical protein